MSVSDFILMYHDVWNHSPNESGFNSSGSNVYKVPVDLFKRQIEYLSRFSPDTIVTIDDGGISSYTLIAPILEKYDLRGHFYIVTNLIGTKGFMTGKQVRNLVSRGHIVGSHSCSHPQYINALSKEERCREWTDSVAKVSSIIGGACQEVSIPNGYYNDYDLKVLANLGIKVVYTSDITDSFECYGMQIRGRLGLTKYIGIDTFEQYFKNSNLIRFLLFKQMFLNVAKKTMGLMYNVLKKNIRYFIH